MQGHTETNLILDKPLQPKQYTQVAVTFLLSSWFVLAIALHPPVLTRLVALARPSWNPLEVLCHVGMHMMMHHVIPS